MDPQAVKTLVAAGACGIGALWSLRRYASSLTRDRFAADTPLSRIRSAAQGYVRLYGVASAAPDATAVSPLGHRQCVWWEYRIEERQAQSRNSARWRTVQSATSTTTFLLQDDDGACLVGPVGADITPTHVDVWFGEDSWPAGRAPPAAVRPLFESGNYRYTEKIIEAGARLTVLGEFRSQSENLEDANAQARLLAAWKADQPALLRRFDADHNGRIDQAEWETARSTAAREVQQQKLTQPLSRVCVVQAPANSEPFVIAALDGTQLVQRERRRAFGYLVLGIAFTATCAVLGLRLCVALGR